MPIDSEFDVAGLRKVSGGELKATELFSRFRNEIPHVFRLILMRLVCEPRVAKTFSALPPNASTALVRSYEATEDWFLRATSHGLDDEYVQNRFAHARDQHRAYQVPKHLLRNGMVTVGATLHCGLESFGGRKLLADENQALLDFLMRLGEMIEVDDLPDSVAGFYRGYRARCRNLPTRRVEASAEAVRAVVLAHRNVRMARLAKRLYAACLHPAEVQCLGLSYQSRVLRISVRVGCWLRAVIVRPDWMLRPRCATKRLDG